jgi:hypothetical protein
VTNSNCFCPRVSCFKLHSCREALKQTHIYPASHTRPQSTPTKDGPTILNKHSLSLMERADHRLNSLNPFTRRLILVEACSRSVRKIHRAHPPRLRHLIIRDLRCTMSQCPALSAQVTIKVPLSNACCGHCEFMFIYLQKEIRNVAPLNS